MAIRILISVLCLSLASVAASAQIRILPREKVESVSEPRMSRDSAAFDFDSRHLDAGTMSEDEAPRIFTYRFRNAGDDVIRIKRLVSTCSCASASASRMEIPSGESAEINVRYNPKGHPGRFERKVFVYTEDGQNPAAVLRLSVHVESGADLSGEWPVQMGTIRLRRTEVTFDEGDRAVAKMRFINIGDKPLQLECEDAFLPACLSFRTEPEIVQKGETGEIYISYDPSKGEEREVMKVILKGLEVPPSRSSITVRLSSVTGRRNMK